ncbi:hypothetical protein [Breoghania sp.]|uniref:hypothetical protein n=1 Tax=Breoghania sp. TaxID=2065378 RepID=UPI002AA7553F|nr:hypothetical protein [Breoghania sp.]
MFRKSYEAERAALIAFALIFGVSCVFVAAIERADVLACAAAGNARAACAHAMTGR